MAAAVLCLHLVIVCSMLFCHFQFLLYFVVTCLGSATVVNTTRQSAVLFSLLGFVTNCMSRLSFSFLSDISTLDQIFHVKFCCCFVLRFCFFSV